MPRRKMDTAISRTLVERHRMEAYQRALQRRREESDPELSFAAWVRLALDAQAAVDLGIKVSDIFTPPAGF